MSFTHLQSADYRVMPWKDGGGVTTELCIEPPGATLDSGFLWRLSMARVERSGPFSAFPGMDRSLLILEGGGMDLHLEGQATAHLRPGAMPVRFSGDLQARAELLGGPVMDFGVISNRAWMSHGVARLEQGPGEFQLPPAPLQLLFVAAGEVDIEPWGGTLRAQELLRADGGEYLRLRSRLGVELLRVVLEPA